MMLGHCGMDDHNSRTRWSHGTFFCKHAENVPHNPMKLVIIFQFIWENVHHFQRKPMTGYSRTEICKAWFLKGSLGYADVPMYAKA